MNMHIQYIIDIIFILIFIISSELLAQCGGCLGWVWQARLAAGLRVGQAFATWVGVS